MGSFAGQRTRPTHGVKGSKGGAGSQPRVRLAGQAAPPESSELQKQSSIYLRERNKQMKAKRLQAEMELAISRGLLIEKSIVERQLAYLLISTRQKILALPGNLASRFGAERFPHEMVQAAKVLVAEALLEVSQLPEAASPDWLEKLEEDGK